MSSSPILTALLRIAARLHPRPPESGLVPLCPKDLSPQRALQIWRLLDEHFGWKARPKQLGHPIVRLAEHMVKQGFSAPPLDVLDAVLDDLVDAGSGLQAEVDAPIPVVSRNAPLPLSSSQRRLWFLFELDGPSAVFNIFGTIAIDGPLDAVALEASIDGIIARHESLRSAFRQVDGEPMQVVLAPRHQAMRFVDVSRFPFERARMLALAEGEHAFDLRRDALFRFCLLRLSASRHLLVLNMHHIISDGWSVGIFMAELAAHYDALLHGRAPVGLPVLPIQYPDYAAWQARPERQERIEGEVAWWQRNLAGLPERLSLPCDFSRPAVLAHRGETLSFAFPPHLTSALSRFANRANTTPFVVLLCVFAVQLSRYSGQRDLAVGTPVAGRHRREVEHLIGFFINNLALRLDLGRAPFGPSFSDLVGLAREVAARAFEHAEAPFEQIVEALDLVRGLDHAPVFQVMLSFQNMPTHVLHLAGLCLSPIPLHTATAQRELTLNLDIRDGRLGGSLNYNSDLFERASALRFKNHFECLLDAALRTPSSPVFRLPLVQEAERLALLSLAGASSPRFEVLPFHELVGLQALRHPAAEAMVGPDLEALSYGELWRRCGRLAVRLRGLGVRPGQPVALLLADQAHQFIGLLAVLRVGGFFIPVDPEYPEARIRYMLDDARPAAVISDEAVSFGVDGPTVLAFEAVDEVGPALPTLAVDPLAPIYAIYTSGSSGQPKGVLVPHAALVTTICATRATAFGNAVGANISAAYSFSFDGCANFWGALAHGFRLVAMPPLLRAEVPAMADFVRQWQVQLLLGPTATMPEVGLLLDKLGFRLDCLTFGGEAIDAQLWSRLAVSRHSRIVNAYGPTETAVRCTQAMPSPGCAPHIGSAMPHVRLFVCSRHLLPQPLGVPGELLIGGPGVALGYLHRPSLTAASFIPDPFATVPGARLYRSGDLVRLRNDRMIAYLGRIDRQVKVRGFRIEPGEIAQVLCLHELVQRALVVVHGSGAHARLDAYVVGSASLAAEGLRSWLMDRLPHYMVPATFTRLDAFPLTPVGKVDLRALPDPALSPERSVPPEGPTEVSLARIWREVLALEQVDRHGNFFALGGHSLLGTVVINRINAAFRIDAPLRLLFEKPVLWELALAVEDLCRLSSPLRRPITPLDPALFRRGDVYAYPVSFNQERLWFMFRLDESSPVFNMPNALILRGPLDVLSFAQALCDVAWRYESLRTHFAEFDDVPMAIVSDRLPVLTLVDLGCDEVPEQVLKRHTFHCFDLAAAPPWYVVLLRLSPLRHQVLLNIHHSISDGFSKNLLVRDMIARYEQILGGCPPPMQRPLLQYRDFAMWQRSMKAQGAFQADLDYWVSRLASAPSFELRPDRPRPAVVSFTGASHWVSVAPDTVSVLAALARSHEATLFMVLLTAVEVLLARITGQADVLLGTVLSGRNHPGTEEILGWFSNPIAHRRLVPLGRGVVFEVWLDHVKEATQEAYEHQDVSFAEMVDALDLARDRSRLTVYQILFNMLNLNRQRVQVSGLTIEETSQEAPGSKGDLTIYVAPADGWLRMHFLYNSDLYDAETIHAVSDAYVALLEGIAADPGRALEAYDLVVRPAAVLAPALPEVSRFVPWLVLAQAERAPASPALVFRDRVVSYAALAGSVRLKSAMLRRWGVVRDARVALALPRSAALIESMLAVGLAGGAYVWLDPDAPVAHQRTILEDCGACLVIHADHLGELAGFTCRSLSALESGDGAMSEPPELLADQLAYVAFTSGSSGRPKGIAVPHRQVAPYLLDMIDQLGLSRDDVMAQLASPGFDAALRDMFAPLLIGAHTVIADGQVSKDPVLLLDLWVRHQVSCVLSIVPSVLRALLSAGNGRLVPRLRWIQAAGEVLLWEDVAQARAIFGRQLRVVNLYGASECTMSATRFVMNEVDGRRGPVAVGRPEAGAQIFLLDRWGRPLPPALPGECYIGGPGVARGYISQPALSAASFVPNPFAGSAAESRLYRTGDLVRLRSDADGRPVLFFLDRLDRQVKVRGVRVEPAEVERLAVRHPSVERAAVVAVPDKNRSFFLALFVVGAPGLQPVDLRVWLGERANGASVPAIIEVIEVLPLLATGKIDRQALIERARCGGEQLAYLPPINKVESVIAEIWQEVLGVSQVGRLEDFFSLGGHSLLATRVVNQLRERLAVALPISALFEAPTVAALARLVEEAELFEQVGDEGEGLFASFSQDRLLNLYAEKGQTPFNMATPMRVTGPLVPVLLTRALSALCARHEILRTHFRREGGRNFLVIDEPAPFPLWVIDLPADEEVVRALLAREAMHLFPLERGPLFRVLLLRHSPAELVLVLSISHLISDGWSQGILMRELMTLYQGFWDGSADPCGLLPPLPIQWSDHTRRERFYLSDRAAQRQLAWWAMSLDQMPPFPALPFDRDDSSVAPGVGGRVGIMLDAPMTAAIDAAAREVNGSRFSVLVAATACCIQALTGAVDFPIANPISGRWRADLEPLIGFFVDALLLRMRPEPKMSFRELLVHAREVTVGAFANQDVPLSRVIEDFNQAHERQGPPHQVLLTLLNPPPVSYNTGPLQVEAFHHESFSIPYELVFTLVDRGDHLSGSLVFRTAHFSPERAERIAQGFVSLLREGLKAPQTLLADLADVCRDV